MTGPLSPAVLSKVAVSLPLRKPASRPGTPPSAVQLLKSLQVPEPLVFHTPRPE